MHMWQRAIKGGLRQVERCKSITELIAEARPKVTRITQNRCRCQDEGWVDMFFPVQLLQHHYKLQLQQRYISGMSWSPSDVVAWVSSIADLSAARDALSGVDGCALAALTPATLAAAPFNLPPALSQRVCECFALKRSAEQLSEGGGIDEMFAEIWKAEPAQDRQGNRNGNNSAADVPAAAPKRDKGHDQQQHGRTPSEVARQRAVSSSAGCGAVLPEPLRAQPKQNSLSVLPPPRKPASKTPPATPSWACCELAEGRLVDEPPPQGLDAFDTSVADDILSMCEAASVAQALSTLGAGQQRPLLARSGPELPCEPPGGTAGPGASGTPEPTWQYARATSPQVPRFGLSLSRSSSPTMAACVASRSPRSSSPSPVKSPRETSSTSPAAAGCLTPKSPRTSMSSSRPVSVTPSSPAAATPPETPPAYGAHRAMSSSSLRHADLPLPVRAVPARKSVHLIETSSITGLPDPPASPPEVRKRSSTGKKQRALSMILHSVVGSPKQRRSPTPSSPKEASPSIIISPPQVRRLPSPPPTVGHSFKGITGVLRGPETYTELLFDVSDLVALASPPLETTYEERRAQLREILTSARSVSPPAKPAVRESAHVPAIRRAKINDDCLLLAVVDWSEDPARVERPATALVKATSLPNCHGSPRDKRRLKDSLVSSLKKISFRKSPSVPLRELLPPAPTTPIHGDLNRLIVAICEMGAAPEVDYWSMQPYMTEQWEPADSSSLDMATVDPLCLRDGFHVEHSRSSVSRASPGSNVDHVLYTEEDFCFFKKFLVPTSPEHFCCTEIPAILSVEGSAGDVAKAILWTKKGAQRLLVSSKAPLRSIKELVPQFEGFKFARALTPPQLTDELVHYEEKSFFKQYKFGVLYVRENQTDENEIFSNLCGSAAYEEFLGFLGQRIDLKGWGKYRGGLDIKSDNTGKQSVYTELGGYEIMFHVATMLPFQPEDAQRVERKRHIGNDVVVIVYKEQAHQADCFNPRILTSHFNHIFLVVTAECGPDGRATHYRLTIANKPAVPPYPPFMDCCRFEKGPEFWRFLITKCLNGERAALASPEFSSLVTTRKARLGMMCSKYT
eukprot:m51a1_g5236 hypothetical protein (1079) ;mRNA; f:325776-335871